MRQRLHELTESARWFIAISLIVLTSGILCSLLLEKYDANIFLAGLHGSGLHVFFKTITRAGEPLTYFLALILFLLFRYRYAVAIPILLIVSSSIGGILKQVFQHPRPFTWLQTNGNIDAFPFIEGVYVNDGLNSFPSGHSLTGFALFTFIALTSKSPLIQTGCLFIAVCVAISRIYLGHHFLQDVVFGSILGWMTGIGVFLLQETYLANRKSWDRGLLIKSTVQGRV